MAQTYRHAGVNIAAGDQFVREIRKTVRSTYSKSVLGDIGAFGAFFDARFKKFKSPVLVSSVDGVGTKLMVAQMLDRHDTVGQDLVNHCVNDILVCGATPLYFLDYFAAGKLHLNVARQIIGGFVKACKENGCSLIGGETAEMPGLYKEDEYDLAGSIVGVVERDNIITGQNIKNGDALIGLPSTGLHTNGYSLARSVLLAKLRLNDHIDELGMSLGEALLAIHRSYLKTISAVWSKFPVHGLSHITGGGIEGNTMRVIPRGLTLHLDWSAWERPQIFRLIQRLGDVPEDEMRRTFNLGIGLIMIVPTSHVDGVMRELRKKNEHPLRVGEVIRVRKSRRLPST